MDLPPSLPLPSAAHQRYSSIYAAAPPPSLPPSLLYSPNAHDPSFKESNKPRLEPWYMGLGCAPYVRYGYGKRYENTPPPP